MDVNIVLDRLINSSHKGIAVGNPTQIAATTSIVTARDVSASDVSLRTQKHTQWRTKVEALKKLEQPAQRSPLWYSMRNNMITASDIAQCLGEGKFGTQREFFEKKVDPSSVVFDSNMPPLVWGVKYEPVANMLYCKRNNTTITEFGLLPHPKINHIGASPDGISADGVMVEIKCPWKRQIDSTVPKQYYYQIQFQLDVCDLDECDYLEVKFSEYDGWNEFAADVQADGDPNGMVASNGNEKGLMIEYSIGPDRKYEYPDILVTNTLDKAYNLRNAIISGLPKESTNVRVTYWRVDVLSIIRVYRDEVFLQSKYPEIERVWERVVAYRNNSSIFEQEVRAAKKPRERKSAANAVVCLCDDD